MKKQIISLLLILAMLVGISVSAYAASLVTINIELEFDYSAAYEELEQLNEIRRENGLNELVMDKDLILMARQRAVECAVYYDHTRPNGENFSTAKPLDDRFKNTSTGENILYGSYVVGSERATEGWYNSPGHRANMLFPEFKSVGIACVKDVSGRSYWVQNFSSAEGIPEENPEEGREGRIFSVDVIDEFINAHLDMSELHMQVGEEELVYVRNDNAPIVPDIVETDNEAVIQTSPMAGGIVVTAVGSGTATLTLGFSGYSTKLTVVVEEQIELEKLSLIEPEGGFNVKTGEDIYTTVQFLPSGAPEYPLEWKISDTKTASISALNNGCRITGKSPGTATLTVTAVRPEDGQKYSVTQQINVYDQHSGTVPVKMNLSAYYVELVPGEQVKLMGYIMPETADQSITWTSKDPSVATVNQNGIVTAVSHGNTSIVAVSNASGELDRSCEVVVNEGFLGKPVYFPDVKETDYYYDAVAWATCQNLEDGFLGHDFGAGKACTRMDIVRYLWTLMGKPQPQNIDDDFFEDISSLPSNRDNYWAVNWALEKGITDGTSKTKFSPDDTVTRAQAVTFLYRLVGMPSIAGSAGFDDVPAGDWFADAAVWAVKEGITQGTGNNTFTPDRACTRAEILTFLFREFS